MLIRFVLLLLALMAWPRVVAAEGELGWVTAAINETQVMEAQVMDRHTEQFLLAKEGDAVALMDTHQTQSDSRLRMLLEDNSVVTLGEQTKFQTLESRDDSTTKVRYLAAQLTTGIVRALTGAVFSVPGSRFEIRTPTATVSATQSGAYFIVWVTDCEGAPATGVLTLEGQVTVNADGQDTVLPSLFYTRIGEQCPPALPLAVPKALMEAMTQATSLSDPVHMPAMEISEQIDPILDRVPVVVRMTPPIVQPPPLVALTRVRVHVVFP